MSHEEGPLPQRHPEHPGSRGADTPGSGRQVPAGKEQAAQNRRSSDTQPQNILARGKIGPESPSKDHAPPRRRESSFVWNDTTEGPNELSRAATANRSRGYSADERRSADELSDSEGRHHSSPRGGHLSGTKRARYTSSQPTWERMGEGGVRSGSPPVRAVGVLSGGVPTAGAAAEGTARGREDYEYDYHAARKPLADDVDFSPRGGATGRDDAAGSDSARPARSERDQRPRTGSGASAGGAVVRTEELCSSGRLWTETDDEELVKAMRESGAADLYSLKQYLPLKEIDWGEIGKRLVNKISCVKDDGRMLTNKQIRDRWEQHLRPGLLKHKSLTLDIRREILQFVADNIDDETIITRGRQRVQWVNIVHRLWAEGICCSTSTVKNIWNSYQSTLVRKQNRLKPARQPPAERPSARPGPAAASGPPVPHEYADDMRGPPPARQSRYPQGYPPMQPYSQAGYHDASVRYPPEVVDRHLAMGRGRREYDYLPPGPAFPPPSFAANPEIYYGGYPYPPMRAQHGYLRPDLERDPGRYQDDWEQSRGGIVARPRVSPMLHGTSQLDPNMPEFFPPARIGRHLPMPAAAHPAGPLHPPYPPEEAPERFHPSYRTRRE